MPVAEIEGLLTPGVETCLAGFAFWCAACQGVRYRHDMRWTTDGTFGCWVCLGRDVGTPALPSRRPVALTDEDVRDMLFAWGLGP